MAELAKYKTFQSYLAIVRQARSWPILLFIFFLGIFAGRFPTLMPTIRIPISSSVLETFIKEFRPQSTRWRTSEFGELFSRICYQTLSLLARNRIQIRTIIGFLGAFLDRPLFVIWCDKEEKSNLGSFISSKQGKGHSPICSIVVRLSTDEISKPLGQIVQLFKCSWMSCSLLF